MSQLAVRRVIFTVYITGGSGQHSSRCSYAFPCFAGDVKRGTFPNTHLVAFAGMSLVGQGAGWCALVADPLKRLALPIA